MTGFVQQVTPMILTFNEEDNIERTLAPLGWAREIVVIDSGSTDATLSILGRDSRIRVVTRAFDSFARQCNFGLSQIRTPWVLSLDADYVISPDLAAEIASLDPHAPVAGYQARFVYRIFGRSLRATLYPPRTILYRVDRARYRDEGHGHRVEIDGSVKALAAPIFHDDRKPIDRWFLSQIGYARREADHLLGSDRTTLGRIDRFRLAGWPAPIIMLFYTLFVRGCILDGWPGIYYSFQRTIAELMLAVALLDRRLRRTR